VMQATLGKPAFEAESRAKPTPGLEPVTPSLRVNYRALAGRGLIWPEVAREQG
jgi:hypothetical protein